MDEKQQFFILNKIQIKPSSAKSLFLLATALLIYPQSHPKLNAFLLNKVSLNIAQISLLGLEA